MEENPQPTRREKIKSYITKRNIFVTIFLSFFVFQYFQMQSILGTFSFLQGRDSSLVTEIGKMREAYIQFGGDLNEVRKFLRLPTNNYLGLDDFEQFEEKEDENQNELQLKMFKYVEHLASEKRLSDVLAKNRSYINFLYGEKFAAFLEGRNLNISPLNEKADGISASIKSRNEEELIGFYLGNSDGKLFRRSVLSSDEVKYDDIEDFEKEVVNFIEANQKGIEKVVREMKKKRSDVENALASDEALKAMSERGIRVDEDFNFYNKLDEMIGEIVLEPAELAVYFYDKKDTSVKIEATDIQTALIPFLNKLDTRTYTEKKAETALADLQTTLKDKGFHLLLSSAGLKVVDKPREDHLRYYYDIYAGDVHVSSFVLEKKTGVVSVVDASGGNAENILLFEAESKKKL